MKYTTVNDKALPENKHAEFEDLEAWDKAATLEPTTDE